MAYDWIWGQDTNCASQIPLKFLHQPLRYFTSNLLAVAFNTVHLS